MRKILLRSIGLSTLVVLLAGSIAAQSLPPDSFPDLDKAGLDPAYGRAFTHSVLAEFGAPTG